MLLNQEHRDSSSERNSNPRGISDYWRAEGLSVRASNVLSNTNIVDKSTLLEKLNTFEKVIRLRNCGKLTAEEIWSKIEEWRSDKNDKDDLTYYTNSPVQNRTVSENSSGIKFNYPSIELPLLEIKVSESLWNQLQKVHVDEVEWNVRTWNCIEMRGCLTLADIVKMSSDEWLKTRNFGRTSLNEIKQRIQEIVNQSLSPYETEIVPLLGTRVSKNTWRLLEKTSIDELQWSVRTWNCLSSCNCKTLADIVKKTPTEWLTLKNFGNTSLEEIKQKIYEIINEHRFYVRHSNPQEIGHASSINMTFLPEQHLSGQEKVDRISDEISNDPISEITSLYQLGELLLKYFDSRERNIVKIYYGFDQKPKTLEEAGKTLNVTRERVRQIKENINRKLQHKSRICILGKGLTKLYEQFIIRSLEQNNGVISIDDLRRMIGEEFKWGEKEKVVINWFDDAIGRNWLFLGSSHYKANNNVCQVISGSFILNAISSLVEDLGKYGYKPLALDGYLRNLNEQLEKHFNSDELINYIKKHPQLKTYEFGSIYIGLKDWEWFNPAKKRSSKAMANLIEWFLRMKNEPCTAEEISYGILDSIGDFKISPFTIAEICNANNFRFSVFEQNKYGLDIWKYAPEYKQKLERILSKKPLTIEEILRKIKLNDQSFNLLVVATLNFYKDTFVEKRPFIWALSNQEKEGLFDLPSDFAALTFEDLIPN